MPAQRDTQSGSTNVRVKYKIEDSTNNSIRHGWVKIEDTKVERSFLRFEKKKDAKNAHKNLSKLEGVSFLKSYFIIKHRKHYWLAVDKIQYSLKEYIKKHSRNWNGSRLVSQYQDIIRGIIIGICDSHRQGRTVGSLSMEDILIVNDKPKFALIRNKDRPRSEGYQDFEYLKDLFTGILGIREELKHFYKRIRVNTMLGLSKLYFHPILMAPMERFFQPIRMDTLARYPHHEKASDARHLRTNNWIEKLKKCYKRVKNYEKRKRRYGLNVWDLFKFVRNAILHINKYVKKTEEEVEKDLSTMLPASFNEIYDLFEPREIALGSREPHLESPTKATEKKRTRQQSPGRSSKRVREPHLESPTKDREKKGTRQQSPERSSKRTRRDHQLNPRSEPSPPTQMPRSPPSSSRQSSLRRSPA